MECLTVLLTAVSAVAAFPGYSQIRDKLSNEQTLKVRADIVEEGNCRPVPCTVFDAEEQLVSIDGEYAFVAPGEGDHRGPCPGLNAAANHGYIPHNGVLDIAQTVSGLANAYGMGADLAAGLAAVAVAFDGDITTLQWSIGGPQDPTILGKALFGTPRGLSFSHNNYEGDASIGRPDAFTNNGDAYSLDISRFKKAYGTGMVTDRYTIDAFRELFISNIQESIASNPYYFSAQFAGLLVAPAAYNFVINFMSNHTAAEPSGYLNGDIFKEFFSVTGDYPDFTWTPGHEKIPSNWYRRTSTNQYGLVPAIGDVATGWIKDPNSFRLGGNVNGTNTYVGVDTSLLTGGVYNAASLLEGNNLGYFVFQAQSMYLSTNLGLSGLLPGGILGIEQLIARYLTPITDKLACPSVQGKFHFGVFDQYPGRGIGLTR